MPPPTDFSIFELYTCADLYDFVSIEKVQIDSYTNSLYTDYGILLIAKPDSIGVFMDSERELRELRDDVKMFGVWIVSALIDSAFLASWAFVQWIAENIVSKLELSGIDKWLLVVFRVIFAVSTVAPVLIYIYVDIRVMLLRAKRRISREVSIGKIE